MNSAGSRFGEQMRQNPERFIALLDGKLSKEEARQQPQFASFVEALP